MLRVVVCLLMIVPGLVRAQEQFDNSVNLNVVLSPATYSGCADPIVEAIEGGWCPNITSGPVDGPANAWIVVSREGGFPGGIGGVQFGLDHDPMVTVMAWSLCTGGKEVTQEGWPAAGTGNAVTWENGCGDVAGRTQVVVGYVTLASGSATGVLDLTLDPRIGDARHVDCASEARSICRDNLGGLRLSDPSPPVCGNQCVVPVVYGSWGQVKSLFTTDRVRP